MHGAPQLCTGRVVCMGMKRTLVRTILILAAGSLMFLGTAVAQSATTAPGAFVPGHPRVNQVNRRQVKQQARINQGVCNGTVNPNEARRLERGQQRVQRHKQYLMNQNNGHLTKAEQRHINRMQNRQSKRVYNAKHNGR